MKLLYSNKIKALVFAVLSLFVCMDGWCADGPEMNQAYTIDVPFTGANSHNISKDYFLSGATSTVVQLTNVGWATMRINQWGDNVIANGVTNNTFSFELTGDNLTAALAGNVYLQCEPASNSKLTILNKDANYQESTSGGESGSSGSGNTGGGSSSTKTLAEKIAAKEQLTDVPTIYLTISAAEGQAINTVLYKGSTPEYFDAKIQVVDNSAVGSAKHLESFTDDVKIKVRGNSTANMEKKPYRLKFGKDVKDEAGNVTATHKHDLIGDGYSKRNWTLLANAYDGSKIRNALNQKIGQLVGMDFCPGYKFVDLVINGEYRGCYQVSDHVEVGKHRIDVDEDTGWYIEASRSDMCEDPKVTAGSLTMSIKNPEPSTEAETTQLISEVETFFNTFSQKAASYNTNLTSPTLGWRSVADEESAIAFYIGTNLTANYDGFMTVKMFRDVSDPRIHFGPLWDMDLAYGHYQGSEPGKLVEDIENGNFRWYIKAFMSDPGFVKKLHDKWHALVDAGLINTLKAEIDRLAAEVNQSQALDYEKKWTVRMQGMNGTYESYDAAITYLKNFIEEHVPLVQAKIDKQYEDLDCANYVEPTTGGGEEETPTVNNDALQEVSTGVYKFTGSASTFKEGTVITITTSSASTTLSNYITEGTSWNTTKSITLTAADVTALAANSYTFYMNASGGEVMAVNVKVPVENTGAELNKELSTSYEKTSFNVPYTQFNASASSIKVTIDWGNTNGAWTSIGFSNNAWDNDVKINWTTNRYSEFTITDAQDIADVASSGMTFQYGNDARTVTITVINYGSSSGSTSTPQYSLTLNASEGGTVTGAGTYDEGTTVLIKAIPNTGYVFTKWSDDNTNATRSVTLSAAMELTATFAAESETPTTRAQLTNLPTIYLDATVGNEWSTASLEVYDADNKLTQGTSWTSSAVSVQYQGGHSEGTKDSYRLKFDSKTKLLSSGKFKQWVLASNDDDPSMINNALAKELGDLVGMPFTPGYQFVDLYLNDTYMGTYQVTDRIKTESGRALVTGGNKDNDWHVRINDGDEITEGGYTTDKYIAATSSMPNLVIKNPDPDDLTATTLETLKGDMNTWFTTFFAKDADSHYSSVADNVDKQQLINWYICQEVLGIYKGLSSIEAYRSITETAADHTLHFGPLWDNETAFGNRGDEDAALSMSDLNTADSYNGLIFNIISMD